MNAKNQQMPRKIKGDNSSVALKRNARVVNDVAPDKNVGNNRDKRLKLSVPDEAPEISIWYEKKRSNMRRLFLRLATFTVLPTLLAALYFGLIVTDRYVSEFQMTVNSQDGGVMSMFSSILGSSSSGSGQENYIIEEFIQSQAALAKLDELLDLRGHYSQDFVDTFSRLDADATNEEFLAYYRSRISVDNDTTSMIITVQMQAFSPDMAKTISDLLIALCEDLVNNLNEQSRLDTLAFSQDELNRAEERFRNVRKEIYSFRNREGDIDPVQSAAAISAIITSLESQVTEARVQIARDGAYMRPDSVRISSLNDKLNALTDQVEIERKRLVSTKDEAVDQSQYVQLLSEYESLLIEEGLAQGNYQAANQANQIARSEAAKKQYVYLIAFAPPVLPDESLEPQRLYSILVVFVGSLIFYMLGSFTWAAVREHIGA